MQAVRTCPNCGTQVNSAASGCPECGLDFATRAVPSAPGTSWDYSGVKNATTSGGTGGAAILSGALAAVAVLLLVIGFVVTDDAITQTALFAAAAVVGILARMVQAAGHHRELMDELRKG